MKSAAFAFMLLLAASAAHAATVTVDGVKGADEWTTATSIARESYVNGNTAPFLTTTRFVQFDANYLYVAIEADTSDPEWASRPFNGVNLYAYTSSSNPLVAGGTGVYGDDGDIILEGTRVLNSRDGSTTGIWGKQIGTLSPTATPNVYVDAVNNITIGFDSSAAAGFYEAAIPMSLLNGYDYTTLRIGGQAWAYGFTYNNFAVPQAPAVPLPAAAPVGLLSLAGLAAIRRYIRR